jgi:hypothetical protein
MDRLRKRNKRRTTYGYVESSVKSTAQGEGKQEKDLNVNVIIGQKDGSSKHKGSETYAGGLKKDQSETLEKETAGKYGFTTGTANIIRNMKDEQPKGDKSGSSTTGETGTSHKTTAYYGKRNILNKVFKRRTTTVKAKEDETLDTGGKAKGGEEGTKVRDRKGYNRVTLIKNKRGGLKKIKVASFRPDGQGGFTKSKSKFKINSGNGLSNLNSTRRIDTGGQLYEKGSGKKNISGTDKTGQYRGDTYRSKGDTSGGVGGYWRAEDISGIGGNYKIRNFKDKVGALDKSSPKDNDLRKKKLKK